MPDFFLIAIIVVFFITIIFLFRKLQKYERLLQQLLFEKQSMSVRHGKTAEQWLPFSESFPFNAGDFRFIGSPVDGIVFSEDRIVFCEFKTSKSDLSGKQKKVKELVQRKQVEWLELRAG